MTMTTNYGTDSDDARPRRMNQTEKKDYWKDKTRVLNKYVTEADTDHNRWTFRGEFWEAIEELLQATRKATLEEAKKCILDDLKLLGGGDAVSSSRVLRSPQSIEEKE